MRSFLRLHQSGKARFMQGSVDEDGVGSYIYLTGEEDALMVDETVEDIDRLVALS